MSSSPPLVEVGLSLGSNIGDKVSNIRIALVLVREGVRQLAVSSLYRTSPWGFTDQDWFVNACAIGVTSLSPTALLAYCQEIEKNMGRQSTFRWGPRIIDIDILYYGDQVIETPDLNLPHPEILNRAFVVIPLAEIRPERVIRGIRIGEAAAEFRNPGVERMNEQLRGT